MVYDETILHGYAIITQTMAPTKQTETEENSVPHDQASSCFWGNLDSLRETKTLGEYLDQNLWKNQGYCETNLKFSWILSPSVLFCPWNIIWWHQEYQFQEETKPNESLMHHKAVKQLEQRMSLKKIWVQYSGKPNFVTRVLTSTEKNKLV